MKNQSDAINELAGALAKAQSEIHGALKDSSNPFFKSKYADLASVWGACREQLSKNGLCVIQTTHSYDTLLVLTTMLAHSSGQWIRGTMNVNPVKNDPQGVGSALTYCRRYALSAMVGVPQVDDDGESAMSRVPDFEVKTVTKVAPKLATPIADEVAALADKKKETAPLHPIYDAPSDFPNDEENDFSLCCGKKMIVSKFNPGQLYCLQCKRKATA
jgi:hypothetical protein